MNKLIKLIVITLAAISIMACNNPANNNTPANNNNIEETPALPELLISASEAATLTETGTLPDDFTDGDWSYQDFHTSTSIIYYLNSDQYIEFTDNLTEDEIALLTITPYSSYYGVTIPIDMYVASTINNFTKSGTTYTVSSSIATVIMTATNAKIRSIMNKYAALNYESFSWNWNGNTASVSMDQTSVYSDSSNITGLIDSTSRITWQTNNDKSKFYFKNTLDSNNYAVRIIIKK